MVNYGKSFVYKLCCKDTSITDEYIGSTTNFSRRKSQHKYNCVNLNEGLPVYIFINNNGGWNNWSMILIEEFSCENKIQLCQRERYWIEERKPTLNIRPPFITIEEGKETTRIYNKKYNIENRDINNLKKKEKYEENKKQILEKLKEKIICECGAEVCKHSVARHQRTKKHQDFMNSKEG